MALIKAEPRGDYYIGRRWVTHKTHFWGYVRRPGESWEKAKLVVMKEDLARQPDRLPEVPQGAHGFGFDHNYEYKLKGRFTGEDVYDPNSNWFLPWFQLESYELISANPGWLFSPDATYDPKKLPRKL